MHVVNHLAGEPAAGETRDILVEAARMARGEIQPLAEVDSPTVDAVLLPGGFGAAKNLCNFAVDGDDCTVNPEVEAFLREAHAPGKPIGAMCIAPVILARVFGPDLKPSLTIGNDPATAAKIEPDGRPPRGLRRRPRRWWTRPTTWSPRPPTCWPATSARCSTGRRPSWKNCWVSAAEPQIRAETTGVLAVENAGFLLILPGSGWVSFPFPGLAPSSRRFFMSGKSASPRE